MAEEKKDPMAMAQALIGQMMGKSENFFLLTYEGSKIPRGAAIDNVEIGWTQHGMVTGKGGEQLGYYERIVEFGGSTGNTQVMLIATNGKSLTPPPSGTVNKVDSKITASPAKNKGLRP